MPCPGSLSDGEILIMASESETVYCLCRQPYDETQFMIECDVCKDWFHGNCVGVQEHQASDIEIYHCPNCQLIHGPLVLKSRRNWHRHDYSEPDPTKAVQTGTVVFIKELKNRTFPSAEEIPLVKLHGNKLTPDYLEQNSFDVPILVEKKDGLGLRVPPPSFTIQDVENYVGSMREIDVIDVARQEDYKMLMREWTEYYNSPNREKIFNVISLEFSNTRLAEFITPPTIVRQVSWVVNMWPDQLPEDCPYSKPEVQKYCLMGVRDSFTDFHVDFGGTSVWYHVLRGEKVFYLIKPTSANLVLYESWISSSTQSETFFGDQVDFCYKCVVRQGQTLFIPTGWIHAVFTPIDTLVFGGNFLHNYNIPLQLQVFEIEKRVKTPEKYMFPSFETMCWHAAKHVLDILRESEEDKKKPKSYIVQGAKALACHLKSWTQRKDLNTNYLFVKTAKHNIPEHVQYGKLLKDLTKLARHFEMQLKVSPKPKVDRKRRKKNMPTPKQMQNLDILHQHTQEKLQEIQEEHKNVYIFQDDPPSPPAGLKVRIPKGGVLNTAKDEKTNQDKGDISTSLKLKVSNGRIVGDGAQPISQGKFQPLVGGEEEEDKDSDPDQLVVDETPQSKKKNSLKDRINSRSTMKPGSLKLKLSVHGKVKQETAELKQQEKLEVKQVKAEVKQEKAGTKQEKAGTKQEKAEAKQEKAEAKQEKAEAKQEKAEAKQEKAEAKQEKAETKQEKTETKQEPEVAPNLGKSEVLKSRATTSKQQNTSNVSVHSKVKQEGSDSLDQEEVDISASAVEQSQRMNMPTIRGGLNCSIADILEASGYGTETDFQVDDEIGRAPSPSMRDAIQGMLSMSRMGGLQLFGGSAGPNSGNLRHSGYPRNFRPSNIDDEDFEQLNSCYKDEEYVYPSLDISDDEAQHIFKPRGKLKKDETWNPKARVQVSGEKREHMSRDSAKREAVESGLAAAAAKYASAPPSKPKKPNRKKLKTECIRSDPDPQPSTSSAHPTIAQAAGSLGAIHHISKALSSPSKPKKPKKGFATAKQRLGRILKIHKMRF